MVGTTDGMPAGTVIRPGVGITDGTMVGTADGTAMAGTTDGMGVGMPAGTMAGVRITAGDIVPGEIPDLPTYM